MVNIFTKFTLGSFIKNKTPDTIIDTIVQMWIGFSLSSPKKFLADNCREFPDERFRDMCKNVKIQVLTLLLETHGKTAFVREIMLSLTNVWKKF